MFQRLLAQRGQRVTPQRVGIYRYLTGTDTHPTAEEIYRALKPQFPGMSPATVYKTLELLTEMGLITELGFGHEPNRYDGNPGLHLNLICVSCGGISDVDEPLLEELVRQAAERSGFEVLQGRHEFYGRCPACQAAAGAQAARLQEAAGGHP